LIDALKNIRFQLVSRRILMKPSFQDFDKARSSHVTRDQFARVLKKLDIYPLNDFVFELIVRKYLTKGTLKEMNYVFFCKDVDKPEDMFPEYRPKREQLAPQAPESHKKPHNTFYNDSTKGVNVMESRFSKKAINISNDPSDILNRLQAAIVMKRVRIEEFFRDFDKLRKGKVTIPQFKSILSNLNFSMEDHEMESIA